MDERKVAGHCPLCGELAYHVGYGVECACCGWSAEQCVPPRLVVQSVM
jgi:ribosomal protein L37E